MAGFGERKYSKKHRKKSNNSIDASKLLSKAFQYHSDGNITEAKNFYELFFGKGFSDPRALSNYGSILEQLGETNRAVKLYREAIRLYPRSSFSYYNLALILRVKGELNESRDLLLKAIELKPDFTEAFLTIANIYRDIGDFSNAELFTRKGLQIEPDSADLLCNLAIILRDLGSLEEAKSINLKSLKSNPNLAMSHLNLGNIYSDLGDLKNSEISTREAIKLNPNISISYLNLGVIMNKFCRFDEAKVFFLKAINLQPDLSIAYLNLGKNYEDNGDDLEAFECYYKTIQLDPSNTKIYSILTDFLNTNSIDSINSNTLEDILSSLLDRSDINHRNLFPAFERLCNKKYLTYSNQFLSDLLDSAVLNKIILDRIVLKSLRKVIIVNPDWEKLLTIIRREFLYLFFERDHTFNDSQLKFIISLAEQCFLNEYVYSITIKESNLINKIINQINKYKIDENFISIIACYLPLFRIKNLSTHIEQFKSNNHYFHDLLDLQFNEPLLELDFSSGIKKVGFIKDNVSQKVRSQYEENPYPRWRYAYGFKDEKLSATTIINQEIKPNKNYISSINNNPQILLAGCGTGNQIFQAQRYKNASITAIDLSASSLSYAQRKLNENKITNVDLIQMDILDVSLLDKSFDIIECGGVLHHMKSPKIGLESLVNVLNINGFMKLALYSDRARQSVVKARKYISENLIGIEKNDMRKFRDEILRGNHPELKTLMKLADFYTASEFRDLCFHQQEHRFTISQLEELLNENKLQFLGFMTSQKIQNNYHKLFPNDTYHTKLKNWNKFEIANPETFISMFQFWVKKN